MAAKRKKTQIYLQDLQGVSSIVKGNECMPNVATFSVTIQIHSKDFDELGIFDLGNISVTKFKEILRNATY